MKAEVELVRIGLGFMLLHERTTEDRQHFEGCLTALARIESQLVRQQELEAAVVVVRKADEAWHAHGDVDMLPRALAALYALVPKDAEPK